MATQIEDLEARTRLALGDNQIELLQAVRRYAVALESISSIGSDPFLSTLRSQIEEEGKGTISRTGFQHLDWLISKANANHGKKYEGMADHERHINVMRDAMDEMQALCEGGEAAKKVVETYKWRNLSSVGCGRLSCLEDANKVALEEKFLLTVGPIMNASIDVDRQIKLVLADAVAMMMLADLNRFGLDGSANNAMHLRERVGVAMDNGVVDRFADRVEIGRYGERKEIKGEPKDEGIAKMDKAVAELLAQDAFGAYTHPEIKAMLAGIKPSNAPKAYELAAAQARDAFRLVSDVANWEVATHRKTGDVLRIPRAMAEITYSGAMKRPFAVTVTYPVIGGANIEKKGQLTVYVPLKGASTGRRWAVLESAKRGDGFLDLRAAEEVSESRIAEGLDQGNSRNNRIMAVGVAQAPDFSVADILKRELRAVDLGDKHYLYILNVDDSSRLARKVGHLKAGTFLPTIDPSGVDRFLDPGREAPMTHLLTKEGSVQRVVKFDFSEKGVAELERHLKEMRGKADLTPGERARAEVEDARRIALFAANVKAYSEGARGAVVLLPGGQGQQKPDLTGMVVYKAEEDLARLNRGEPALDGVAALKQMITERTESGCPVSQMIFKA
jgi:hypothetical protein